MTKDKSSFLILSVGESTADDIMGGASPQGEVGKKARSMNRKLFFQVAGPSVLVGLALFAVCLVGVWFTDRSQHELGKLLSEEVESLQAGQELLIRVRQLRFRSFLNLLDPTHPEVKPVEEAQRKFEKALERAHQAANSPKEKAAVAEIAAGYQRYKGDLVRLKSDLPRVGNGMNLHQLVEAHPIKFVSEPCNVLLEINREEIKETAEASAHIGRYVRYAMIALGVFAPLGGLLAGYGIARGLSRSIYRLSVRVHDMARHLDKKVASVTLPVGGDLQQLDQQLQHVVRRIEEAAKNIQRQQQEMLRAEQLSAVGQLAASVAHEVRNPLTSVKLLVEAAYRSQERRPLSDEDLGVIYQEIERLEKTVQSFLDFARPLALHRQVGDLREVIHQAVDLVRARARQIGAAIEVNVPDAPACADVDRGQWCTVLVNLFINALDAMPRGGRLEVVLTADDEELELSVCDSGGGIPPAMLGRLFRPFASTKETGTGLGLSICKRIVEEHGGTIQGANRPAGGACFTLTLPAAAREELHAQVAGH
jgi:signal transduction histidine kinase